MERLSKPSKPLKEPSEYYKLWEKILQFPTWTIKRGKKYDLVDFLSSPTRDYLIKHNGDKVNIVDHLSGKHILLYFWSLPDGGFAKHDTNYDFNQDLMETYKAYNPKGEFEVVFVALGINEDAFHDLFDRLPGVAIPHDDQEARDDFIMKFYIPPERTRPVLFGPDGTVLLEDARSNFRRFGSQGFPFTSQKMNAIWATSRPLWDRLFCQKDLPSLTELFGEYVISPEGRKVLTTSAFEGKIVGLHFFEKSPLGLRQTNKLLSTWKALRKENKNIEIVFIWKDDGHPSIAKVAFEKHFRCPFPWYSPLSDGTGRHLCRVFKEFGGHPWIYCCFVILEPDRYQSLSYFAFEILEKFGMGACPFTLQSAVEFKKSKQQELVLRGLLSPAACLLRGSRQHPKETVCELSRKRVLLLFATYACYNCGPFLCALRQMFLDKKGTADEDFEIIYISLDCRNESWSVLCKCAREMPWLLHYADPDFGIELARKVFGGTCPLLPAIAAFGVNGHLQTKESNLASKTKWDSKFPFIEADMSEEVYKELIRYRDWDLKKRIPFGIRPWSLL